MTNDGDTQADIQAAIAAASKLWDEPERAETLLLRALADAPDSEDALVALYRFYFYRNELTKALALAERCIAHGARVIGIDPDWRQVDRTAIDFGDFGDFDRPRHRFYLFALNAYGYLLARLGRKEEAERALSAVTRLDPQDRLGSRLLLGMVRAGPVED